MRLKDTANQYEVFDYVNGAVRQLFGIKKHRNVMFIQERDLGRRVYVPKKEHVHRTCEKEVTFETESRASSYSENSSFLDAFERLDRAVEKIVSS